MKRFMKYIGIILLMCTLVGCKSEEDRVEKISEEFKSSMEKEGLILFDQTEFAADESYLKIVGGRDENNRYSFEYNIMKDHESALKAYKTLVDLLNTSYKNEDVTITEEDTENGKYYKLIAEDYYCEIICDNDTMLYVNSTPEASEEVIAILKDLDYMN